MTAKHNKIINEAVKKAQIISNHNGFNIGQVVCHPDIKLTCELIEISDGIAKIEVNNVNYFFPLSEIFDPNIAMQEALKIQEGLN